MADPFALTTDPTQLNFGAAPAPPPSAPRRSPAEAMIAPQRTVAQTVSAQMGTPPQQPQATTLDQFMHLVRAHESGGNDLASSGVANGRYQFTTATWNAVAKQHPELGLRPDDIWNGAKQDEAMRAISGDYVNVLKMNGIAPTMPNMFMLHFLGEGGGPKFIKAMTADPNANAPAMFPLEAKYNPTIFWEKGGQPRSLQQVYALMTKTFGGPRAQMAPVEAPNAELVASFKRPEATLAAPESQPTPAAAAPSLPPPPPGITLDTSLNLPPPPPGITLDYKAADPMKPAGGYTDPQGVYHPGADEKKPEGKPLSPVVGVDPTTGAPIFADEKDNEAVRHGEMEAVKGFGAGVAQDITGPASLLPGRVGAAAEEANKALSDAGDPFARTLGQIAPLALPVGEVAGAIETGAKALEAGESMVPSMMRGLGFGSATGALSESSTPTGKESFGERIAAKAPNMAAGAAIGGLGGAAVPGLGVAAQWVKHEFGDILGRAASKAAEDLRTGFDTETGKALTEETRAAKIATIERAAEKKVIADQAARETTPPEKVGAELQTALDQDRQAVMERRRIESGFAAAVKSDGGAPLIRTKAATDEIAAVEKKYDIDLSDLKSRLATKSDTRGGPTVRGVSIERGRDFIETLNKRIEDLNSGPAHALMKVRDDFIEHMENTHPQLKAARQKYAELSRDVDIYERKGKLAKASESDLYSKKPILDPTRVKSLLTDKSEAAGQAIERLIKRDPEIQDTLRRSFNHDLFGSGAAAKVPSVDTMTKFLANNRVALERSGLYKEFEKLRDDRAAFEGAAEARKAALDARHQIATVRTELTKARKPAEIVAASKKALNMLIRDKRIPQSQYGALLDQVKDVETHIEDHAKARSFALKMGAILAAALGGEEVGRYIGHRYNPR